MKKQKIFLVPILGIFIALVFAACSGTPTPEPTVARPTRAHTVAATQVQIVPTKAPPSQTQNDDLARVKQNQKLVVGTSADYAPFEFYASDNSLDGFDIAVIHQVAERMGVQAEIQDYAFDGLFDALKLGQIDASIAALSITPERQRVADFSVPYYLGEDAALARGDANFEIHSASDTLGRKVGVQRGTVYETWLAEAYLNADIASPGDNFVLFENANDMLQALRNKQVDVLILGAQPALAAAKSGELKLVGQAMNAQEYGIATRKSSTLIPEMNRVLLQMYQDGSLNALMKQYLQLDSQEALLLPEVAPQPTEVANSGQPIPVTATPRAGQPQGSGCVLGMNFVADVNLDDLDMKAPPVMQPGQPFTKTWRVQNNGTCEWQPDYALMFVRGNVAGADMGGGRVVVGRAVKPGETLDLSANLIAPNVPGVYQGFWHMRSNTNAGFGKTIWVGIAVPGAQVVPTPPLANLRLRADAMQIYPGQCTVIRWDVDNVTAVGFIDGSNAQGVNAHDARTVCPQATTTYTLRATTTNNQTIESPITITVINAGPNLRADNSQIQQGQCTTVRWNVTNAQAVYFFDGAREQGVGGNDARKVCPQATTTYRLRVVNADNSQNQYNLNVNVIPSPVQPTKTPQVNKPRIQSFTVNHNKIKKGACVNLHWATKNTPVGVTLQRNGKTIMEMGAPNGSQQDCPPGTGLFTYTLIAAGEGIGDQAVQQSLTVQVGK